MARSLALVLCLAAAPSACALSSRRRVTPAFPHVGQMHSRTATGLTTVMELRGGSLLSEHQLLSYVAYAVASTAAAGSAIALIGALAVLGWVKKPILSESGARSRRWSELKDTLLFTGAYETLADGKAAEHAAPARREAAKKLIMNHERVLHDLTRTDGPPKSQPELSHGLVLMGQEHAVDIVLREIARRLIGRLPRERAKRPLAPTSAEQAAVWKATAEFLSARLQSNMKEMEGVVGFEQRKPDMSEPAAAAFRAVLSEVAAEEVTSFFKRSVTPLAAPAAAVRPAAQVGP